jgi:hypothetical protein
MFEVSLIGKENFQQYLIRLFIIIFVSKPWKGKSAQMYFKNLKFKSWGSVFLGIPNRFFRLQCKVRWL